MNGAKELLLRVIVERYYFLNGGFFIVIFLLLFGIVDPASTLRLHYDLIVMMGAKPAMLAGALAISGAYFIKCLRFALLQIAAPENAMLYELQALHPGQLRKHLTLVSLGIYAPALLYCCCVIAISAAQHAWLACGITLITQPVLILFAVHCLERRLMQRMHVSRASRMLQKLEALRPAYLGFGQYFTAFLLSQKKMMLLLLKTGSLLLLQVMVYINKDEPERTGTFYVLLFLIIAHGLVPWQLRQFSESLPWLRNLPLSFARRYAAFAGTYLLLFLPEAMFLFLHVRTSLSYWDMLSFYALSTAMLCGLHAILYLRGMSMDRYLSLMTILYPLSIIALAMVSPWEIAAFWMLSSIAIFRLRFNSFETAE
jgi:hypothetical protein